MQTKIQKEEYWKQYLDGIKLNTNFSFKENISDTQLKIYEHVISKEIQEKLCSYLNTQNITMESFIYSIWGVLLQIYTNTDDILFGTEKVLINDDLSNSILPLRVNINSEEYIITLLQTVNDMVIEKSNYENISLKELLPYTELDYKDNMFDSLVIIENNETNKLFSFKQLFELYNLNLIVSISTQDNILINFTYNKETASLETIQRLANHFINIINQVITIQNLKIKDIDILSQIEKDQLLFEFNNTTYEYPKNKTIQELFEQQVKETPENVAVVYNNSFLTYRELNEKSNQLARVLREKGVNSDNIVGIMVDRSLEMIIGIMGILKAGGAYLPIDMNYPADRIKYMLEDSNANILLSDNNVDNDMNFNGITINIKDKNIYQEESTNLNYITKSNNLAYIIYTSGSTGKPKGVMIEHKSLVNLCIWHNKYYKITSSDRATRYAGFGFDASVWELFPYLLVGATVHVINDDIKTNPHKLNEYFQNNKITISFLPTQMCEQFMELENNTLKTLITGGDKLRIFKEKKYQLVNNYGPTENTIVSTYFPVNSTYDNIPIGKPIFNTQVYILNKDNNLQPIGVAGELCLSGDNLARGYLNRPDLTSEKFINNPFSKGQKLYKTGDLARWLTDGNIEFLGRIDHQVEIRGFRIELGEIESELLNHESIDDVVVIANEEENHQKFLTAYIVSNEKLTVTKIREYLSKKLPEYMIPSYFVNMEQIPLTANGKVNKKALPAVDKTMDIGIKYEAPSNKTEEKILKLWNQILNIDKIGINDDFFSLGGHSLKAGILASYIHKEFNVNIPIKEVINHPTIKELAKYVISSDKVNFSSIEVLTKQPYYSVSSTQKRLLVLDDIASCGTSYNEPFVMTIEGNLDSKKLERTFQRLIKKHEPLRTSFKVVDGDYVQVVHDDVEFNINYIEAQESMLNKIIDQFIRPFNLNTAPLLRVQVVQITNNKHLLMLDFHHIIIDGTSMNILVKDIVDAYEGKELSNLKVQYKDYSKWQSKLLASSDIIEKQKKYWLDKLSGDIPVLNMPTDYKRGGVQSFDGNKIRNIINKELTEKLNNISLETGSTLYMLLLASYNVLVHKYTNQNDIIIGSVFAGRSHLDLENIIGMFVNTLPIRTKIDGNKTFRAVLEDVKKSALDAYDNQDYQLEELLENLNFKRDFSRNPLFDIAFVMQNMGMDDIKINNLKITPYEFKQKTSKFDFTLEAIEKNNEITLNLEYCTILYKKDTMERLLKHFIHILNKIVDNIDTPLSKIHILLEEEKQKLLVPFNDTDQKYPKKTIHKLFEEQVDKTPNNTAVVFNDTKLTYKELDDKANQVAHYLVKKANIKPEMLVGIIMNKSSNYIISIMGVLKASAAYVPIDPSLPQDRIKMMLNDSSIQVILSSEDHIDLLNTLQLECINFNTYLLTDNIIPSYKKHNRAKSQHGLNDLLLFDMHRIESQVDIDNLAYVIYTSGTTGKPKGTLIEHKGIASINEFFKKDFGINKNDHILQFASISFDASVWEIFMTLLSGAALYIPTKDIIQNISVFENYINNNNITVATIPPTYLSNINPDNIYSLRTLITAGSATNFELLNKWKQKVVYINAYGPTETTICATTWTDNKEKIDYNSVPIGKPIFNTKTFIVDKDNNLQPIGVPGELCVTSDGLARGYLNRPELTADKFIKNPLIPGKLMYKTGDLAKWLNDGNIEFLGRIDDQVKIRGFRIELGEIENQLVNHDYITEAAIIVKDKDKDPYLCAYIVCTEVLTPSDLRTYLAKELPEYMVPSNFIFIDTMPLTVNGKVDVKKLPDIDTRFNRVDEYIAPRNKIEEKIAKTWEDVLGIEKISVNDDFFILGGHSLKAAKVIAKLQKDFEIGINHIYEYKTIAMLSQKVELKNNDSKIKVQQNTKSKEDTKEKLKKYNNKIKEYKHMNLYKKKVYDNILLTGSTGFLGIHLLHDLLNDKTSNIYVIIRGITEADAIVRLIEKFKYYFDENLYEKYKHKLFVLNGDITKEYLGLKIDTYNELSSSIDCIIHSAANVKHYGYYENFHEVNVKATERLLQFAKLNKSKDFQHISTTSVASGNIEDQQNVVFTEYDCDLNQNISNYYAKTKLEAEKLVLDARKEGINTNIFRIGNIVFNSSTGKFQENIDENAFYSLIKSYIKIGMIPESKENIIDFSFVDYVSKAILYLLDRRILNNKTYHLYNTNQVELADLLTKEDIKLGLAKTSYIDFVRFLNDNYSDNEAEWVENIKLHWGWLDDATNNTTYNVISDKTNTILKKLGFNWPSVNTLHIKKMIDYCKEVSFI